MFKSCLKYTLFGLILFSYNVFGGLPRLIEVKNNTDKTIRAWAKDNVSGGKEDGRNINPGGLEKFKYDWQRWKMTYRVPDIPEVEISFELDPMSGVRHLISIVDNQVSVKAESPSEIVFKVSGALNNFGREIVAKAESIGKSALDTLWETSVVGKIYNFIAEIVTLIAENTKSMVTDQKNLMDNVNILQKTLKDKTLPEINETIDVINNIGTIANDKISDLKGKSLLAIFSVIAAVNPDIQSLIEKVDKLNMTEELTLARDTFVNLRGILWEGASIRTGIIDILEKNLKRELLNLPGTAKVLLGASKSMAGILGKIPVLEGLENLAKKDNLLEFLKTGQPGEWKEGELLMRLTQVKDDFNKILEANKVKAFGSFKEIINKIIMAILNGKIDLNNFTKELQKQAEDIQNIVSNEDFIFRQKAVEEAAKKLGNNFNNLKTDFAKKNFMEIPKTYKAIEDDIKSLLANSADMLTYLYELVKKVRVLIDVFEKQVNADTSTKPIDIFTKPIDEALFALENHINDVINVESKILKEIYSINYQRPKIQ